MRGLRQTLWRAFAFTLMATAVWVGGCSTVAGVDFDEARLGAGLDADLSTPAAGGEPGSIGLDGGPGRGSSAESGSPQTSPDGCTPDPNAVTCARKCGPTEDNCKQTRACSEDCGAGKACVGGACTCATDPTWCKNRCGSMNDNCGRPVDCGGCAGNDQCTNNSCGCSPEPATKTCAGKSCGFATNNCGQVVPCGNNGSCAAVAAICLTDGSCCTDDGAACNGRCAGVQVTNNCGQKVGCPQSCPGSKVCTGTSCCTPEPLATTCSGVACGPKTNNCGESVTCPNTCTSPQICGGGGAGPNGCGCNRNSDAVTCSGVACGPKTNNCGESVTCPNTCSSPNVCGGGGAGPNGCGCTSTYTCALYQCGLQLGTDNCGQPVTCPNQCSQYCFQVGHCAGSTCSGRACSCSACP